MGIKREESKNYIGELKMYAKSQGWDEEYQVACDMAIKALEQDPRWIPVEERLPSSDEEYHSFLVTDSRGNVTVSEFYLRISDKTPYWSGMIDIVAWMPLPQPYREVKE